MACKANLGLRKLVAHLVVPVVMDVMATGTGHPIAFMGAGIPEHATATLVAIGTGFILLVC